MSFTGDDFNRTNGAIGPNYTTDTTNPLVIVSGRVQITPQGSGAAAAHCINTWRGGGNDGKFYTDAHEIRAQMTPSGYGLATNNSFTLIIAGSDGTYQQGVNVAFGGYSHDGGGNPFTPCIIQTGNGATYTTRASTTAQVPMNAIVRFRRVGSLFSVFVNEVPFLSWNDTAGIIPSGPGQRRCRIGLSGNRPIFQQQYQSASIDEFWAYDIAA
ncbi:DUF7257 domain-containing protein [Nocardia sp. CA-290969]|uniref:DUF7257 domain-containing protein n=1 Tax=Nocardia sp. CA-290969 TaxID=3239986 RepID=UPI003D93B9DB